MKKTKQDVSKAVPAGSSIRMAESFRRATITAPPGHLWVHNHQEKLYYDQPSCDISIFYADIIADVSRGTYKKTAIPPDTQI